MWGIVMHTRFRSWVRHSRGKGKTLPVLNRLRTCWSSGGLQLRQIVKKLRLVSRRKIRSIEETTKFNPGNNT